MGRFWSAHPAASLAFAASLLHSIRIPEKNFGRRLPSLRPANPAAKRGLKAAISGKTVADRFGSHQTMIPRRILSLLVPATAVPGWATSGPETISTRRRRLQWTLPQE